MLRFGGIYFTLIKPQKRKHELKKAQRIIHSFSFSVLLWVGLGPIGTAHTFTDSANPATDVFFERSRKLGSSEETRVITWRNSKRTGTGDPEEHKH